MTLAIRTCLLAALLLVGSPVSADWPQFLGPARDGSYHGPALATNWPAASPATIWSANVGEGFSGPIALSNRVYLFHRRASEEILTAFNAADGKVIWESGYPAKYQDDFGFDEGPRATPAATNDRIFTYGAEGMVRACSLSDGRELWRVDARERFGSRKGFFGRASSPLVVGDLVVINVGGENGAGLVAFRAKDGAVAWKSNDDEASYASPVLARLNGKQRILALTRERFVIVEPADGKVVGELPFRPKSHASVSAATPLVAPELIFLSASYGVGAAALRWQNEKLQTLWRDEKSMGNHYATCVIREGLVFGYDGRQEEGPDLACIELGTGVERWREKSFGGGTINLAGDQLAIVTEKGELILALASGAKFAPSARAQILGFGTRAHPALSDGFLYARSKDKLVCVDLRAQRKPLSPVSP